MSFMNCFDFADHTSPKNCIVLYDTAGHAIIYAVLYVMYEEKKGKAPEHLARYSYVPAGAQKSMLEERRAKT